MDEGIALCKNCQKKFRKYKHPLGEDQQNCEVCIKWKRCVVVPKYSGWKVGIEGSGDAFWRRQQEDTEPFESREDELKRLEIEKWEAMPGRREEVEVVAPEDHDREVERQRIMRGNRPGHGWRNY